MYANFTVKILKKHSVIISGLIHQAQSKIQPFNGLLHFGTGHEWEFGLVSPAGDIFIVNSLKHLFIVDLAKFQSGNSAQAVNLGNWITLPKLPSHGYIENGRFIFFDRAGDIYSQTVQHLKDTLEKGQVTNSDEIYKDLVLETSNFCSLVTLVNGRLHGKEVVAYSDQYYKIRLTLRSDFHRLLMTCSLRTRYADTLHIFKEKYLLTYFDDGKLLLLDEREIVHCLNNLAQEYEVSHKLVGKASFFDVDGNENLLVVHLHDPNTLHLARLDIKENSRELVILTSLTLEGQNSLYSRLLALGNNRFQHFLTHDGSLPHKETDPSNLDGDFHNVAIGKVFEIQGHAIKALD